MGVSWRLKAAALAVGVVWMTAWFVLVEPVLADLDPRLVRTVTVPGWANPRTAVDHEYSVSGFVAMVLYGVIVLALRRVWVGTAGESAEEATGDEYTYSPGDFEN